MATRIPPGLSIKLVDYCSVGVALRRNYASSAQVFWNPTRRHQTPSNVQLIDSRKSFDGSNWLLERVLHLQKARAR